MDGDRYFYRHSGVGAIIFALLKVNLKNKLFFLLHLFYSLIWAMLEEVKRRSLSDIICENTDIKELTQHCFVQVINSYAYFVSPL